MCEQKRSVRGGFRAGVKTIRYALPQFSLINPRTYIQSHTPTVVQGGFKFEFLYVAVFRKDFTFS